MLSRQNVIRRSFTAEMMSSGKVLDKMSDQDWNLCSMSSWTTLCALNNSLTLSDICRNERLTRNDKQGAGILCFSVKPTKVVQIYNCGSPEEPLNLTEFILCLFDVFSVWNINDLQKQLKTQGSVVRVRWMIIFIIKSDNDFLKRCLEAGFRV